MYLAEKLFIEEAERKAKEEGISLKEGIIVEIVTEICDHLDDFMEEYYEGDNEGYIEKLNISFIKGEAGEEDELEFETDRVFVYSLETGECVGS